jgi:hypothetical protein
MKQRKIALSMLQLIAKMLGIASSKGSTVDPTFLRLQVDSFSDQPDLEDCTAEDVAYLVWRKWMKESIAVPEGISCDVLDWSNLYLARFPLIAKVAQIVLLATPASEAICECPLKRAKHIQEQLIES